MKKLYLLLFFTAINSFFVLAQTKTVNNLFALNIGNFANPESVDFAALQKLGLVYAVPIGGDQATIFVGDFADKASANTALLATKKGFPEAYIAQKKATTNTYPVIQIASKKVGEKINWKTFENAGSIFASSDGKITRIFSANFSNDSIAKIALDDLRKIGYKDAVLRKMSEVNLHKIGIFESGLVLNNIISKPVPKKVDIPKVYEAPIDIYTGNFTTSELKRALSVLGTYKGTVDDKPDTTLNKAFELAKSQDKNLMKYTILSKAYQVDNQKISELQQAINNIPKDAVAATKVLEKSPQAIAKAYRAYLLFTQNGDAKNINTLMNEAIQTAFKGIKENKFGFDASATYDYKSLGQLIKHLRFIQGVSKDEIAVPVWLFAEHPTDAKAAFLGEYKIEATDPAMDIEAVRITKLMADDLVATTKKDAAQDNINAQFRTQQMLNPQTVKENPNDWNKKLWEGLERWAPKDALNQQSYNAFKASYYQATLQLQKHLSTHLKTANETTLRNTALAMMKTIVAKPLEVYGRQLK